MNFKITVIITTYNSANTLIESINSILNQTFSSWFLIIVDDGSTDNTKEILLNYKKKLKKKLLIISNNTNLGINKSLNKAIKNIKTPFFTRQDADDISSKDRLAYLYTFLQNNKNYDFVSSKTASLHDRKIIFPKKFIINPKIQDFLYTFPFCNAPTLFRSKVLEKVKKFNESDHYKKRYEDYEFFFRCYLNNYVGKNLNKVTYYVNQNNNYHFKISLRDRLFETRLKFEIYKKTDVKWYLLYIAIIPIIKYFISLFLKINHLKIFRIKGN